MPAAQVKVNFRLFKKNVMYVVACGKELTKAVVDLKMLIYVCSLLVLITVYKVVQRR